jgi:hypothetical protein
MIVASITSSSDAPVKACTIVASADCASGTSGCPFGLSARPSELGPKLLVKQLMTVLSQEHK